MSYKLYFVEVRKIKNTLSIRETAIILINMKNKVLIPILFNGLESVSPHQDDSHDTLNKTGRENATEALFKLLTGRKHGFELYVKLTLT